MFSKILSVHKAFWIILLILLSPFAFSAAPVIQGSLDWTTLGVLPDLGTKAKVYTVDNNDVPYVVYADPTVLNKSSVIKFDGTTWVAVGASGFSGAELEDPSMIFDSTNTPHLAYRDSSTDNKAIVKKFNGTSWVNVGSPGFTPEEVRKLTLVIDSNDTLYLGMFFDAPYFFKGRVYKFNGSSWADMDGYYSATRAEEMRLDFDSQNSLFLQNMASTGKIQVQKRVGSDWQYYESEYAGISLPSDQGSIDRRVYFFKIDSNDRPRISFRSSYPNYLAREMTFNGTDWVSVDIPDYSLDSLDFVFKLNSSGDRFIAYDGDVKTIVQDNWYGVGVSKVSTQTIENLSLGFEASGRPFLGYELNNQAVFSKLSVSDQIVSTLAMENNNSATTIVATDSDGDTLTYLIVGGVDASTFSINESNGVLTFNSPPNFENPTDNNLDNIYEVNVKVDDGGAFDTKLVKVTVGDINEAPTITSLSLQSPFENKSIASTIVATDDDGNVLTYSIDGGVDSAKFTINTSSGLLSFNTPPDFEIPSDSNTDNIYELMVKVSDPESLFSTQSVQISVINTNDPPNIIGPIVFEAVENQSVSTTIIATDLENDVLVYTIDGGHDANLFTIDSDSGLLTLSFSPDHETPKDINKDNVYDLIVKASDPIQGFSTSSVQLTIINTDEPLVFSSMPDLNLDEDFGVEIIDLAIDELDISYDISSTNTSVVRIGKIDIDKLFLHSVLNASGSATIYVTANTSSETLTESFEVIVNPINDAPFISGSHVWSTVSNEDISTTSDTDPIGVSDFDIDSVGKPYVVYRSANGLIVKKLVGNNWVTIGEVITTSSIYPDIKLASDDTPFVSAVSSGEVKVFKYDGISWVNVGHPNLAGTTIDSMFNLDSNDVPYLAYVNSNTNKINVIKFDGLSWQAVGSQDFSSADQRDMQVKFGLNNVPYVAFRIGNDLKVMKYNGSDWIELTTMEDSRYEFDFGLDSKDNLYTVALQSNRRKIKVDKYNGQVWSTLDTSTINVSSSSNMIRGVFMEFDSNDNLHVIHLENGQGYSYLKHDDTQWINALDKGEFIVGVLDAKLLFDSSYTPYMLVNRGSHDGVREVLRYQVDHSIEKDILETQSEGPTIVLTIEGEDVENDVLTYAIDGGFDADKFVIDESLGTLSFIEAPRFNNAIDHDENNTYEVNIKISENQGSHTSVPVKLNMRGKYGQGKAVKLTKFNRIDFEDLDWGEDVTIEFWIKPDAGYTIPVFELETSTIKSEIQIKNGRLHFTYGTPQAVWPQSEPSVVTNNDWQHMAFTKSGDTTKIFVNGVEVTAGIAYAYYSTDEGAKISRIGQISGSTNTFPNFEIDDFRVWNTARTSVEILANRDERLNGNEEGLIGYWPFDEGVGNVLENTAFGKTEKGSLINFAHTDWVDGIVLVPNSKPSAIVSTSQAVNESDLVILDGSGSKDLDGTIDSVFWLQQSGNSVAISDANTLAPTFTAPEVGIEGEDLSFLLTITDNVGATATALTTITINNVNKLPVASAGSSIGVSEGDLATLNGSLSSDPDGTIDYYSWTQTSGETTINLNDVHVESPTFIAPEIASNSVQVSFVLSVADNQGAISTSTVNVTINRKNRLPIADGGGNQNINENTSVQLDASGSSDEDGSISSYNWSQTSGTTITLSDENIVNPSFLSPEVLIAGETLSFKLTVVDDRGASNFTTVNINVLNVNKFPVASVQSVDAQTEGSIVLFDASSSSDPDGTIASYTWSQISGTSISFNDNTLVNPSFEAPQINIDSEILNFKLVVSDNEGATTSTTVDFEVLNINILPVANAGSGQTTNEESLVFLDASLSSDEDGSITSYVWTQISGTNVVLNDANTVSANFVSPSVSPDGETIRFQVEVTDNKGGTNTNFVDIVVNNVNKAPDIILDEDLAFLFGTNITLDSAQVIDPDNNLDSVTWQQTSGPLISIVDPNVVSVNFDGLTTGEENISITLKLEATDTAGLSSSKSITIRFQSTRNSIVQGAYDALLRMTGIPDSIISLSKEIDEKTVEFKINGLDYKVLSIRGENQKYHLVFQKTEIEEGEIQNTYTPLTSLFSNVLINSKTVVISENEETLNVTDFSSLDSDLYSLHANEQGQLGLKKGVNSLYKITPQNGNLRKMFERVMGNTVSNTSMLMVGSSDKSIISSHISNAVPASARTTSFLDSLLASQGSSSVLDLSVMLPKTTPVMYELLNDKDAVHLINLETDLHINLSKNGELSAKATRSTEVSILSNTASIETTIDIAFDSTNLATSYIVSGAKAVDLNTSDLNVNGSQLKINQLSINGELSDWANTTQDLQDRLTIDLLTVRSSIFNQTFVESTVQLDLKNNSVKGISLIAKNQNYGLEVIPLVDGLPVVDDLETKEFNLSIDKTTRDYAISTESTWGSRNLTGVLNVIAINELPVLFFRSLQVDFNVVVPNLPSQMGNFKFPDATIVFSKENLGSLARADLPIAAQNLLDGIIADDGRSLPIEDGITVLSAIGIPDLPESVQTGLEQLSLNEQAFRDMGIEDKLLMVGTLGGVFTGSPSISLQGFLPALKMPEVFAEKSPIGRVVQFNDVQGYFFIRADIFTATLEVGVGGTAGITLPRLDDPNEQDTVFPGGELLATIDITGTAGVQYIGSLDGIWNEPLGMKNVGFGNLAFVIGIDSQTTVEVGLAGDFLFSSRNETKSFSFGTNLGVNFATNVPVPKQFSIAMKGSKINLLTQLELEEVLYKSFITSPVMSLPIRATLDEAGKKAFDEMQDKFVSESFLDMLHVDKLPIDMFSIEDFNIYFATPGASIPARPDLNLGMGVVVEGKLLFSLDRSKDPILLAETSNFLTIGQGLKISGKIGDIELGPIAITGCELDFGLGIPGFHGDVPKFILRGETKVLSVESKTAVEISLANTIVDLQGSFGDFGEAFFFLQGEGGILPPKDYRVAIGLGEKPARDIKEKAIAVATDLRDSTQESIDDLVLEARDLKKLLKDSLKSSKAYQRLQEKEAKKLKEEQEASNKTLELDKQKLNQLSRSFNDNSSTSNSISHTKMILIPNENGDGYTIYASKSNKGLGKLFKKAKKLVSKTLNKGLDFAKRSLSYAEKKAQEVAEAAERARKLAEAAAKHLEAVKAVANSALSETQKVAKEALEAAKSVASLIVDNIDQVGNFEIKKIQIEEFGLVNVTTGQEKLILNVDLLILGQRIQQRVELPGLAPDNLYEDLTTALNQTLKNSMEGAKSSIKVHRSIGTVGITTPPVNDLFVNATNIDGASGVLSMINTGASTEAFEPSHGDLIATHSIWFKLNVASDTVFNLDTLGSSFDTILAVYSGQGLNNLLTITSSDQSIDTSGKEIDTSKVRFTAKANQNYFIAISGFNGESGLTKLTYSTEQAVSVANDDFSNATVISALGSQPLVNNKDASFETNEPEHHNIHNEKSLWWTFTPTQSAVYSISTTGTMFDTILGVYQGDLVSNLTLVNSNDNSGKFYTSDLQMALEAGQTYKIVVSSKDGFGDINLSVNAQEKTWASNNLQETPQVLSGAIGNYSSSNTNAYVIANEVGKGDNSVWFSWTAPDSSGVSFDTIGSAFDTNLEVYKQNSKPGLQLIASNDNTTGVNGELLRHSVVSFPTFQGSAYIIRLSGMNAEKGDYTLNYKPADIQFFKYNDDFSDASVLPSLNGKTKLQTAFATTELNEIGTSNETRGTTWFKWFVLNEKQLSLSIFSNENTGAEFEIFTGQDLANLVSVVKSSAVSAAEQNAVLNGTLGTTYYIRVLDNFTGQDLVELSWSYKDVVHVANDNFEQAISIQGENSGNISFNNFNASVQENEPNHNFEKSSHSLWYRFVPQSSGLYQFTQNSSIESVFALYGPSSNLQSLVSVSSKDMSAVSTGLTDANSLKVNLQSGVSYPIAIDGRNNAQAQFKLSWTKLEGQAPTNNDFTNSVSINTFSYSDVSDLSFSTIESSEPDHLNMGATASIWYKFELGTDKSLDISTYSTNTNTLLALYSGDGLSNLNLVKSNINAQSSTSIVDLKSKINATLKASTVYYLVVANSSSSKGTVRLEVKEEASKVFALNDNFDNALSFSGESGMISGDNLNSSYEQNEVAQSSTIGGSSVWYKWVAPKSALLTIKDSLSDFDYILTLFEQSNLDLLVKEVSEQGELKIEVAKDKTYYLHIDGAYAQEGSFELNFSMSDIVAPANDSFANKVSLQGEIGSSSVVGDGATTETLELKHFNVANANGSVWYEWQAPDSGTLQLALQADYNPGLKVYLGDALDSLVEIGGFAPISQVSEIDQYGLIDVKVKAQQIYKIAIVDVEGFATKDFGQTGELNYSFKRTQPVAIAGQDLTVSENQLVHLIGSSSYDPDGLISSFAWSQTTGPKQIELRASNTSIASFTAPSVTTSVNDYLFELKVSDADGNIATDVIKITVERSKLAPVALAGPALRVTTNSTIQLDGSQSFDLDGKNLVYKWSQVSGSVVSIANAEQQTASVLIPANLTSGLVFQLQVTDSDQLISKDFVVVNPIVDNFPPVAIVSKSSLFGDSGTMMELDASKSIDFETSLNIAEQNLKYEWKQIFGTPTSISDAGLQKAFFVTPSIEGVETLIFMVLVSDSNGLIASSKVYVHVNASENDIPISDAGSNILANAGQTVTLDGLNSVDVNHGIKEYRWALTNQAVAKGVFPSASSARQELKLPATSGQFIYELNIQNSKNLIDRSQVLVTTLTNVIDSSLLVLNVGIQQEQVLSPFQGQVLPENRLVIWTQSYGSEIPVTNRIGDTISINTQNVSTSTLVKYNVDILLGDGSIFKKEVHVNVLQDGFTAPIANAGVDKTIGARKVTKLQSIVASSDVSKALSYSWKQIDGTPVLLFDAYKSETIFISPSLRSPLTTETMTFRLDVTDENGLSSSDNVVYTIESQSNSTFATSIVELTTVTSAFNPLGISFDIGEKATLVGAQQLDPKDDVQITSSDLRPSLQEGLIEFSARTFGATSISVEVHFIETVPNEYSWVKFSRRLNQWLTFPATKAVFSKDRKSIMLTIDDNSEFDDDMRVGVIKDPSGAGIPQKTPVKLGGGGGGCSLSSGDDGMAGWFNFFLMFLPLGLLYLRRK